MKLKLVKIEEKDEKEIVSMIEEWKEDIERNGGNHSPYAIFRNDVHDFSNYLLNLEQKDTKNGFVPDSVFFVYDEETSRFVGAINIRHYLNEYLLRAGGHIGDGIRPSERRKGYGTEMVRLGLEECRKLGIERVLMVCDESNIGSKKTILKNGGVYENSVVDEDGNVEERYWIDLK